MSETELSVICKNCGSEVSPYVTECPYCGARLRKRAPKLERRGDALEAKPRRRRRPAPRGHGADDRGGTHKGRTEYGVKIDFGEQSQGWELRLGDQGTVTSS